MTNRELAYKLRLALAMLRLGEKADGERSMRFFIEQTREEMDKLLCDLIADPAEQSITEGGKSADPV